MRRTVAVLAVVVALAAAAGLAVAGGAPAHTSAQVHAAVRCGTDRWPIKVLEDPGAGQIDFHSRVRSVDYLRQIPRPDPFGDRSLRKQKVTQATLVRYKKVSGDSDIHLVIADPSDVTHTMIVEIPDPDCASGASALSRHQMAQARADLQAACGNATTTYRNLAGTALIKGVGFWDKPNHGASGEAGNGIELHPVLRFASSNCTRP
jgi:hypothetical protein